MSQHNIDFTTVKKPSQDDGMTPEEAKIFELCAEDLDYFAKNYLWVQNSTYGSVLFKPRSYQEELLDAVQTDRFVIATFPRQAGKTTSLVGYLLQMTNFRDDIQVGVTSNNRKNAKEVISRFRYAYENLPWFMKTPVTEYNQFSVAFSNGSSIEAQTTTDDSFRGTSKSIIVLDEFSHVKEETAENFLASIIPSIEAEGNESQTKMIIISTPNGTDGQFADYWFNAINGENGFVPIDVDPKDVPGRDEEFKQKMLKKMSLTKYLQEFECVAPETEIEVMIDNEEKRITIGELYGHTQENIKIKTPYGFEDFQGIRKTTHDQYIKLLFDDRTVLKCSLNHFVQVGNSFEQAKDLEIGTVINNKVLFDKVVINEEIELFDVINTESHTYLSNGITSHNCHFLSSKGTLINSMVLEKIKTIPPYQEQNDLRLFVDSMQGRKLAATIDPGEGIGQDYHVIQITDINTLEQVGEYRNNEITQSLFVHEFTKILKLLFEDGASEIYYTVENNSIGKGVINLIENSEDDVLTDAMFVHGNQKKSGIAMTNPSKLDGCMMLKDMIERDKLKVNSKRLLTELKFFIKSGASYKAEQGKHDDLVMSMVLTMLLLEKLASYEDDVYDSLYNLSSLNNDEGDDDHIADDAPFPIIV